MTPAPSSPVPAVEAERIEAAARAMFELRPAYMSTGPNAELWTWDKASPDSKAYHRENARAALLATPTPGRAAEPDTMGEVGPSCEPEAGKPIPDQDLSERPINRPITSIIVAFARNEYEDDEVWVVGRKGVTCIEACTKSGPHSEIPYVRVWSGNDALAEFCQHNIVGVYFND